MDLAFTTEDKNFRAEVRQFLRDHLPAELARREAQGFHLDRSDVAEWQSRLYHKGWVAPNWQKQFGGTGWTPIQKYIFDVEYGLANAPEVSLIALSMAGPVLCRFGSSEQQQCFLDPMLRGDLWFCQGFSEPQAGSDLASLRTRALRDGEDYVLTGQKTWTTAAHVADYMICLCRTDAEAKPQAGLSMILVPMNADGVRVRPIDTIEATTPSTKCSWTRFACRAPTSWARSTAAGAKPSSCWATSARITLMSACSSVISRASRV